MQMIEAMKQALEALEYNQANWQGKDKAITAIKEVLANVDTNDTSQESVDETAKQRHEPVAWMDSDGDVLSASIVDGTGLRNIPLYTTPPQRTWVGLTDEELSAIFNQTDWNSYSYWKYERDIEAKLKEKNGGQA